MFMGKRITRRVPSVLLGILTATLMGLAFTHFSIEYSTIGNRFIYDTATGIGHGIPPYLPSFYDFNAGGITFAEIKTLIVPAAVIAALAALESLLSASVADGLARTRHDP